MHGGFPGPSPGGPTRSRLWPDNHVESGLDRLGSRGPFNQQQLGTPVLDGDGQAASRKSFPWLCKQVFVERINKQLNELATG